MASAAQARILMLFAANLAIIALVLVSTGQSGDASAKFLSTDALAGQKIWQSRNCISCHALYGLGGHIGPDLTNAVSRIGEDGTRAVLHYGRGKMPPQQLTDEEAWRLTVYLKHIDSTGVYPTATFPGHAFGRARNE